MIVFKTFLKILNKNKTIVIIYTVMLIVFASFNMQTSESGTNFVASKPDIVIVNRDSSNKITNNLIKYMKNNCNTKDIEKTEDALNDALFYRNVNYIIYIPENYGEDFKKGSNPEIQIKSTGDYQASLAEMMLTRYVNVANVYQNNISDMDKIIENINDTLSKQTPIEITSKVDTTGLSKASFYYNFLNYSILAGLVYVVCIILLSFRKENVRKRTIISSMKYSKVNMQLLLANGILAIILWGLYVILSFILVGDAMFTAHGMVLIINSLVFTFCAMTIAFFIANLISNKNVVSGIINVVALGSSFLCGAFIPVEWLPDSISKIAKILPSYWYIQTNELVKNLEEVNVESLQPALTNGLVMLGFAVGFIILSNIVSRKKRKIA